MTYIDVRGPWPILVIGKRTITLQGASRSITVAEALALTGEKEQNP